MMLSLAACGGLGGEPQIAATVAPRLVEAAATAVNIDWQPDIANGARIFAERCVECHGADGDGQGDLVLAGSIERPLDMTDGKQVSTKSPLEWYEIIKKGRIEKLMPPWEEALSEAERWDLTLYAYSLAYNDELLALGERVWRENCGGCALPSLIPPVFSDVQYGAILNHEYFGSALTDAKAAAAVAYVRMQSLASSGGLSAEGETAALGEISGRVAHGTAGGVVPRDTVVQLRYGDGEIGYRVLETTVGEDLVFRFEDIPLSTDFEYMVGAAHGERLFSQRLSAAELSGTADAPTITVYDETHDPFVISVARVDLFIKTVRLEDLGTGLTISQILTYRNSSDRIYTSGRGFDDGREAALLIQFPRGARLLSGDAGGRYVVIEDLERLPNSVIDTLPVMPGESHVVILEYWLPYEGKGEFAQLFNNLMNAAVTVTLSDDLRLEGDWLRQKERGDLGEGYRVYGADLQMEGNPQLRFGISGDPFATSSDDGSVITSEALPALLLGAIALVGVLLGGIGLMKPRKDKTGDEIDGLVGKLARLEEDHDQGRINHDLYHHRRRELKSKLAELMNANE
jgi:mono/diheme cytochrome c family protein